MGKYDHIDFKPPQSVADAAERGLELRAKASPSNRGGLTPAQAKKEGVGSGVQRAVNLKNRNQISPAVIKKMNGFFSRHEKNSTVDKGKKPWEDKGYVAWLLWGGNPGRSWARKILKQMLSADMKAKGKKASEELTSQEEWSPDEMRAVQAVEAELRQEILREASEAFTSAVTSLDRIASYLQGSGREPLAASLDSVANSLDALKLN